MRQRVPPSIASRVLPARTTTGRAGEVLVKVHEDRTRNVPLVVQLPAGRPAELPPDVKQTGTLLAGQLTRELAGGDEEVVVCHAASMAPAEDLPGQERQQRDELLGGCQ